MSELSGESVNGTDSGGGPTSAEPTHTYMSERAEQRKDTFLGVDAHSPRGRTSSITYVPQRRVIRLRMPNGWARACVSGVEAAFLGWATATILAILSYWTVSSNPWMRSTSWEDAYRAGADIWGLILGGGITIGDVTYRGTPTLVSMVMICVLRLFLRSSKHFPPAAQWFVIPGFAIPSYLFIGFISPHTHWWSVTLGAVGIPFLAAMWAVVSQVETRAFISRLPAWFPSGMRLAAVEILTVIGLAGVASIVAIIFGSERIRGIHELLLTTNVTEDALIIIAQVCFLPTVLAWALAWMAGPGFFVGLDAPYSPFGGSAHLIPAFPIFGAIPEVTAGAWTGIFLFAVGLALGVWQVWRHPFGELKDQVVASVIAAALFGVCIAVWMSSATLTLGAQRMAFLGPDVMSATLWLVGEVGGGAILASVVAHPTSRAFMRRQWEISLQPVGAASAQNDREREETAQQGDNADDDSAVTEEEHVKAENQESVFDGREYDESSHEESESDALVEQVSPRDLEERPSESPQIGVAENDVNEGSGHGQPRTVDEPPLGGESVKRREEDTIETVPLELL